VRLLVVCALVAALGAGSAHAAEGPLRIDAPREPAPLVPRDLSPLAEHDHALLQLERGARQWEQRVRAAGGELISPSLNVWHLPSAAARRLAPALAVAGVLLEVEPDRPLRRAGHFDAGDPLLPDQWWLSRIGADRAEPPGPGVRVTVIDSGVDPTHPEFAGRPNTEYLNSQTVRGRDEFHGTAVASLIAAPANGIGIVGVYPQARLASWDASPRGGAIQTRDVIAGLEAAARLGRGVVNLSFGGTQASTLEEQAILQAYDRGVVVVAAAGNEAGRGSPLSYPASLPHVLTVASTASEDRVSSFSSRSPWVDVAAPGEGIPAAIPLGFSQPGMPEGFALLGGTSFATPIVAGATAWIWTARPGLDKTQVRELVRRSARDVDSRGRNAETGFGILDIPSALVAAPPARDPLEPNDDVDQVVPNGLFPAGKAALTRPGRARATVNARLDRFGDPTDVYRVWVPAQRRVTVTLTSRPHVRLQVWGPQTRSVHQAGVARRRDLIAQRLGTATRKVVTVDNRQRRGMWIYADAFVRTGAGPAEAEYRLTVTTGRLPARR
jgi:hypothetical protein